MGAMNLFSNIGINATDDVSGVISVYSDLECNGTLINDNTIVDQLGYDITKRIKMCDPIYYLLQENDKYPSSRIANFWNIELNSNSEYGEKFFNAIREHPLTKNVNYKLLSDNGENRYANEQDVIDFINTCLSIK